MYLYQHPLSLSLYIITIHIYTQRTSYSQVTRDKRAGDYHLLKWLRVLPYNWNTCLPMGCWPTYSAYKSKCPSSDR